jgi:DNA polymerase/3'-5' exonuclease PolX
MFNSSFDFSAPDSPTETPDESAALSNTRIAAGLERVAQLLGEGVRGQREALRRAAALIRWAPQPVVGSVAAAGVEGVHALGLDYELAGIITDWVRCGRLRWLEKLEARRSQELSALPGIGPKLAAELRHVLGVVDVEGLARALHEGQLARVFGFGPKRMKTIAALLSGRGVAA